MSRNPSYNNVRPAQPLQPLMEPGTYGEEFGMRDNTRMRRYLVNFAFNEGGMGDYLNYSAATTWIAKNCPWVKGRLFVSEYLLPLMKLIHKDFPEWEILPGERAGAYLEPNMAIIGPEIKMNGNNMNPQLMNATGCHLTDLGFSYYANLNPAPKDAFLPKIDISAEYLPEEIKKLDGKYIVIPTGSMVPSRWISGKHLNPIIKYVKSIGYTPVFLGKSNVVQGLSAYFADDVNYSDGLDLREKTTVLDAACILQHAALTVGLDCGLLHLAACMKDSNVVFGYNIVEPRDRRPRRDWGKLEEVFLTKKDLACAGCQTKMKVMIGHTFHVCYYAEQDKKDYESRGETYTSPKCIDIMFSGDAVLWKNAIDRILNLPLAARMDDESVTKDPILNAGVVTNV